MKKSEQWLMGEVILVIPVLTKEGRNTIVAWLRATADKIEEKRCDNEWSQPERKYRLKVGI